MRCLVCLHDRNIDYIGKIIEKCKKFKLDVDKVFLDREFYTIETFDLLNKENLRFIVPCKENAPIKQYIQDFKEGNGKRIVEHEMKNSNDLHVKHKVIITESSKTESGYIAYATNDPYVNTENYKHR